MNSKPAPGAAHEMRAHFSGDARYQLHQNHASAHARTVFFTMEAGGGASLRRADAAQVCNNVGSVVLDGAFECSKAIAAW